MLKLSGTGRIDYDNDKTLPGNRGSRKVLRAYLNDLQSGYMSLLIAFDNNIINLPNISVFIYRESISFCVFCSVSQIGSTHRVLQRLMAHTMTHRVLFNSCCLVRHVTWCLKSDDSK